MKIVPLKDYVIQRRPAEQSKKNCTWVRACNNGLIPGAFRYSPTGPWFVDLDIHDSEVRKLASGKPAQSDESIDALARSLGLTQEDLEIAYQAAS